MTTQRRPLAERFLEKVDRSGGPDVCWPWTAYRNQGGYGEMGSGGHRGTIGAHRVAFLLANGPIPAGEHVLHTCDNPPCCNPAHLWTGTQQDNNRDRDAKGRTRAGPGAPPPHYSGEHNPAARLTAASVPAIRASRSSVSALAREHGVSRTTIRRVIIGATWRGVKGSAR